jgi:hypothetical protein
MPPLLDQGTLSQRDRLFSKDFQRKEAKVWENAAQAHLNNTLVHIPSFLYHLDQTQANTRNQQTISAKITYKAKQLLELRRLKRSP